MCFTSKADLHQTAEQKASQDPSLGKDGHISKVKWLEEVSLLIFFV